MYRMTCPHLLEIILLNVVINICTELYYNYIIHTRHKRLRENIKQNIVLDKFLL